jgi:hypothetical protein
MATVDDVRELASGLPRSYEVLVRDRVKFRRRDVVVEAAMLGGCVLDAWHMVVPKRVAAAYFASPGRPAR